MVTLNTDSTASSGGQGKLKYVVYLPWLLLETAVDFSCFVFQPM